MSASTAEIDYVRTNGLLLFRPVDLCGRIFPVLFTRNSLSRFQFMRMLPADTFKCPEWQAFGYQLPWFPSMYQNPGRIPHDRAPQRTHHYRSYRRSRIHRVPFGLRSFQNIGQVDAVFDGVSNIHIPSSPSALTFHIKALHLAIQAMSYLFQHDVRIGIFTRCCPSAVMSANISSTFVMLKLPHKPDSWHASCYGAGGPVDEYVDQIPWNDFYRCRAVSVVALVFYQKQRTEHIFLAGLASVWRNWRQHIIHRYVFVLCIECNQYIHQVPRATVSHY